MHASNHEEVGMEDRLVLTSVRGYVGTITLNRPRQLNALSDALMDALGGALLAFDGDPDVRVIVLGGNPKAFAAGADIAAMANWTYMDVFQNDFITRNWEVIRRIRKPVIAAVAGYAIGGGCELALACDIVIAADNARFAVPEIKLAMMPGAGGTQRLPGAGGTQRLPRAVGKAKAMDMCLSGRMLTADEADRYGLVSRVVPLDALERDTMALATEITSYSLPALMAIKDSVNRAFESSLAEGMTYERRQLHARFASADAREGMNAFLEKRPPQFRHG